jgi:hypothetical protein
LQKRHDFPGNFDLFLYGKPLELVYSLWTIAWLIPWWTNHHGGPRSSQELGHWPLWSSGGAPMAQGDGEGSDEAHQWWNSAVDLANLAGDEVVQWQLESRGEVMLGARTRGEGSGKGCGLRRRSIWRPFYRLGSFEVGGR